MFIQRLSGPTIGFYCLDLFEITYPTYASVYIFLGLVNYTNDLLLYFFRLLRLWDKTSC